MVKELINKYMEEFSEENMWETVKSIFIIQRPLPFSEAGFVTYEKCQSDQIDRAITMERRRPCNVARNEVRLP